MTKPYRMSRREREARERAEAEDDVLKYLDQRFFTAGQSAAVAIRVETHFAAKWEIEQRDHWLYVGNGFICIHDAEDQDREFMLMGPDQMTEIKRLFAETGPGESDTAAEQYVVDILSKFHTDRAWWIAHLVRKYLVVQRGVEQYSKSKAVPPAACLHLRRQHL